MIEKSTNNPIQSRHALPRSLRPTGYTTQLRCPTCQHTNPQHSGICLHCGEDLRRRPHRIRCRHCGGHASSVLVVCPHCGRNLVPAPDRKITWLLPVCLVALLVILTLPSQRRLHILPWLQDGVNASAPTPVRLPTTTSSQILTPPLTINRLLLSTTQVLTQTPLVQSIWPTPTTTAPGFILLPTLTPSPVP